MSTLTDSLDAALDEDGDGVANGSDCAPFDVSLWSIPSEARNLRVSASGAGNLTWEAPLAAGGGSVQYDVLRSEEPADFTAAFCVESDGTDLAATDADSPVSRFAYLVRAENACGGNLGSASSGAPRSGSACP